MGYASFNKHVYRQAAHGLTIPHSSKFLWYIVFVNVVEFAIAKILKFVCVYRIDKIQEYFEP